MKRIQSKMMEQAEMYGIEALAQVSDAQLLRIALQLRTRKEAEKTLEHIRALVEESNGFEKLIRNMQRIEALFEKDAQRAMQVGALLEVCKRIVTGLTQEKPHRIQSPSNAANVLRPDLMFLDHEEMHILLLDNKKNVTSKFVAYKGTVNELASRIAEIFKPAIIRNSPAILIAHNHPTGDCSPSPEDLEMTEKLVAAGKLLGIEVVDHLIIGGFQCVSLNSHMGW